MMLGCYSSVAPWNPDILYFYREYGTISYQRNILEIVYNQTLNPQPLTQQLRLSLGFPPVFKSKARWHTRAPDPKRGFLKRLGFRVGGSGLNSGLGFGSGGLGFN